MKKIRNSIVIFAVVALAIFGLTGCTSKSDQIKDTLSEFEYACRNLDVNAMLKCIDPDVSDPIRFGLAVFSTFTDADYEDLVDGLFENVSSAEFGANFTAEEFLSTISITDMKVKAKKNTATVTCKM